ncbi:MAG: M23 family metallopeptidase [Deltaproteobacteria bacterium]|nr:M23 family metallopeptidase [Deltaproteobacteria bacterium]
MITKRTPKKTCGLISGILFLLCLPLLAHAEEYLWPLDGYRQLTGTFGEFRYDHFHGGIDISTHGETGLPLRAVQDGSVFRIKVSPVGFGRALYLRLDNGKIAVYSHLSRFAPEIEQWVRKRQWEAHEFCADLYPGQAAFPFKQGEFIGYSGDTGNVSPHLHFELRSADNQPINPLNSAGFPVSDLNHPRIAAVAVNPLGVDSTVEGDWETRVYQTHWDKEKSLYTIPEKIHVWGECGIEVYAYDLSRGCQMGVNRIELSANNQRVSQIQHDTFSYRQYRRNYHMVNRGLFLQGKGKFHRLYALPGDPIPFYTFSQTTTGIFSTSSDGSYIHLLPGVNHLTISVEDTSRKKRDLSFYLIAEPPFFQPEGKVSVQSYKEDEADYKSSPPQSTIAFFEDFLVIETTAATTTNQHPRAVIQQSGLEPKEIPLFLRSPRNHQGERSSVGRYRLVPHYNGPAHVRLLITSPQGESEETVHSFTVQTISPEKGGVVQSDDGDVCVTFQPGSIPVVLFPRVTAKPLEAAPPYLEPASVSYFFQPLDITFEPRAEISFRYPDSTAKPDQLAVFYSDNDTTWHYLSSCPGVDDKTITATIPFFAEFALMRDPDPPEISTLSPPAGVSVVPTANRFSARISDKGTGIDYYKTCMLIDGMKVPAEYIPKKGILLFFPLKPLPPGSHSLEIIAVDLVGNSSQKAVAFTVPET